MKLALNKDDKKRHIDYLYKYVNEERHSLLLDGLIRFTQPQGFNDPFELKPVVKSLASDSRIKTGLDNTIIEVIREQFKNVPESKEKEDFIQSLIGKTQEKNIKTNLLNEVSKGMKAYAPDIQKTIRDTFENNIGILSLTEDDHNLLMWAHYANSHQGFVVEFDRNHEYFDQRKSKNDEIRHLRPVLYKEERPEIELVTEASMDIFSVKGKEWGYEREWRMMSILDESDKTIKSSPYDIHLFKIPFEAMTSIIFGARVSLETRERIKINIRNNPELSHLKAYGMSIHDSKYKLIKNLEEI